MMRRIDNSGIDNNYGAGDQEMVALDFHQLSELAEARLAAAGKKLVIFVDKHGGPLAVENETSDVRLQAASLLKAVQAAQKALDDVYNSHSK